MMPKGPKGEKRPRDPNQWAKRITDIVSGEVEDREAMPKADQKAPAVRAKNLNYRPKRKDD